MVDPPGSRSSTWLAVSWLRARWVALVPVPIQSRWATEPHWHRVSISCGSHREERASRGGRFSCARWVELQWLETALTDESLWGDPRGLFLWRADNGQIAESWEAETDQEIRA